MAFLPRELWLHRLKMKEKQRPRERSPGGAWMKPTVLCLNQSLAQDWPHVEVWVKTFPLQGREGCPFLAPKFLTGWFQVDWGGVQLSIFRQWIIHQTVVPDYAYRVPVFARRWPHGLGMQSFGFNGLNSSPVGMIGGWSAWDLGF